MALRQALDLLKAGERINDQLYRSTVGGSSGEESLPSWNGRRALAATRLDPWTKHRRMRLAAS